MYKDIHSFVKKKHMLHSYEKLTDDDDDFKGINLCLNKRGQLIHLECTKKNYDQIE